MLLMVNALNVLCLAETVSIAIQPLSVTFVMLDIFFTLRIIHVLTQFYLVMSTLQELLPYAPETALHVQLILEIALLA